MSTCLISNIIFEPFTYLLNITNNPGEPNVNYIAYNEYSECHDSIARAKYAEIVTLHLIPKLGEYDMNDLSPIIAQRFVTELLQTGNLRTGGGLAVNSVNSIIVILQNSLREAYSLGLTDKYEMDKIKRPKAKEKEVTCFTPAEQKQIEQAVLVDRRPKMKGIVICLYTGLRIGELLALER